ncbi:hypothetical protein FHG87_021185, partial [Trinorchestia longiramus]
LRAEATKNGDFKHSTILIKELRRSCKQLKDHPNIIVRRADKSNTFVVLNRTDYKAKLDEILSDQKKFSRIACDPTAALKTKVKKLIGRVNKNKQEKILQPVIGQYNPSYIYGTVKLHKTGHPLRPIISQIPTPTYEVAKQLNRIISPYLPAKYQINSTDEFLQIIRATRPQ